MNNDETKKYDIEKLAETNNRERKIRHDFDDENDLGMDFFKTMEEIVKTMEKNNEENNTDNNNAINNM